MVAQIDKSFLKLSLKKTYSRLISYFFYEGRPLTTKGRWFNRIVFFLFFVQKYLPFPKEIKFPVFILGTGRSGTTILGLTLGMHNDVGFLNEPKALWSYLSDKEDLIGSYNLNDAVYELNDRDLSESQIALAHRIFGHYLNFSVSNRVVDKYPELIFRYSFVKKIFPDAKFVFLYRNGADTCQSIVHWSERLGLEVGGDIHDWWGVNRRKWYYLVNQIVSKDELLMGSVDIIRQYTNHQHMALVEWIVTMRKGMELVAKYPNDVFALKYEDYVGSADIRNGLLEFLELEADGNYDKYCSAVLSAPKGRNSIEVPKEISAAFQNVMAELGYE